MKYIIVTNEWMSAHGLIPLPTMRKNKTGDKIILHEDYFNALFKKDEEGNLVLDEAKVYAHNSSELQDLLNSEEWTGDEQNTNSADYIQIVAINNLMKTTKTNIQNMSLTNEEALNVKDMYPDWKVGIKVNVGEKYNYEDNLWEVVQSHTTQENWKPSLQTLSIWKKVQVEHAGTKEDPIPYEQMMLIENGKYYTQDGVLYVGIMDAPNGYPNDLKDLHTLVQKVEE